MAHPPSQLLLFSGVVDSTAVSHHHGMPISAAALVPPDQTYWQLAMEPLLTVKTWHTHRSTSIIDLQAVCEVTRWAPGQDPVSYSSAPLSFFLSSIAHLGDSFLGPGDPPLCTPPNLFLEFIGGFSLTMVTQMLFAAECRPV